jgi:drug/metabolite transporter (DMT)-like permease
MMINSEVLTIVFGLASATVWGAGDFSGGFATKRSHVYSVVIVSQLVGMVFLIVLASLLNAEIPPLNHLLLGGIAGISGMIGVVALYSGLASGRMGIVAPVAAVVTAALPVLVGLFIEGLPSLTQLVGFGVALIAVWLLSWAGSATIEIREIGLAVIAGVGFGFFFIFIDQVSDQAILWPLIVGRIASISALLVFAITRRQWKLPAKNQLPIIALAGIFDISGNAFFALATQVGRLDIAAVLASLYPTSTVLLARFILKERLLRQQWLGVIAALVALAFIAS